MLLTLMKVLVCGASIYMWTINGDTVDMCVI